MSKLERRGAPGRERHFVLDLGAAVAQVDQRDGKTRQRCVDRSPQIQPRDLSFLVCHFLYLITGL